MDCCFYKHIFKTKRQRIMLEFVVSLSPVFEPFMVELLRLWPALWVFVKSEGWCPHHSPFRNEHPIDFNICLTDPLKSSTRSKSFSWRGTLATYPHIQSPSLPNLLAQQNFPSLYYLNKDVNPSSISHNNTLTPVEEASDFRFLWLDICFLMQTLLGTYHVTPEELRKM